MLLSDEKKKETQTILSLNNTHDITVFLVFKNIVNQMGSACSGTASSEVSDVAQNKNVNPQADTSSPTNPLATSTLLPGFAVSSVPDDHDAELVTFNRNVEDALSDISKSEGDETSDSESTSHRMAEFDQIDSDGTRKALSGDEGAKPPSNGLSESGTESGQLEKGSTNARSNSSLPVFANRLGPNRQVGTLMEKDRTVDVPDIGAELFVYDDVAIPKSNDSWVHKQLVASRRAFLASSGAGRLVSTAGRPGLSRGGSVSNMVSPGNFQFGDFQVNIMVDELDRAVSMPFDEDCDDDLGMDAPDDFGHPPGEGQNRTSPTGLEFDDSQNKHLLSAGHQLLGGSSSNGRSKTPTRARTPNDGSRMNDANTVSHNSTFGSSLDENRNKPGGGGGSFTNSFTDAAGSGKSQDTKHSSMADGEDGSGPDADRSSNSLSSIPEGAVMLRSGTTCRSITITNRSAQIRLMQQMARIAKRKSYNHITNFQVRTLIGHSCRVKCIAIAPGEKEFVSCSNEDAVVTLYSLVDGKEIANFPGHRDTVISANFSPDGKYLATTSRDHTMVLWDVVTAKQILTFDHAKVVICCVFSRDSRFVATGCQDKVCRLWETRRGKETVIFSEHDGIIISMAYSPNNSFIASASADRTIRVWSTHSGKAEHVLRGHTGIVLSCSFTNDSKRIISNDEKTLIVWSATSGVFLNKIDVEALADGAPTPMGARKLTWTLSTVAPGLFSRFIIAACNNRFVYVLDVVTGEELTSYFCKAPVYCLNTGHQNTVGFGDSFGNVYIATID